MNFYLLSVLVIGLTLVIGLKKKIRVPGPRGLPLFGNLFQLKGSPHKTLMEWSKKYGEIFYIRMGLIDTIVLTGTPIIREALVDNYALFYKRHMKQSRIDTTNRTSIASNNGEVWKFLRKLVSPEFSVQSLKRFEGKFQEEVGLFCEHVNHLSELGQKAVNPVQLMSLLTLNNILMMSMGLRYDYDNHSTNHMTKITFKYFQYLGTPIIGDVFPPLGKYVKPKEFIELYKEIVEYIDVIKDKKAGEIDYNDPKDIMEMLIIEQMKNPKLLPSVRGVISDLITAGSDTTSNEISYFIREMVNHQEIQEKLYQELKGAISLEGVFYYTKDRPSTPYLNACIQETKRRHPVVPLGVPHKVVSDITFRGYFLPKGTQVLYNVYATQNDPNVYENPSEFNPNRFLGSDSSEQVSKLGIYGYGFRNCLGMNLAEYEIFIVLATVFRRFKLTLPDPSQTIPDEECFGLTLKPKDFECIFEKRLN